MRTAITSIALFLAMSLSASAQEIINLYPDKIPNAKESSAVETFKSGMYFKVTKPTLEAFLPEKDKATGAAVIICPGGGYAVVVYQGEGIPDAKEFAKHGIAAFVLKYRLPADSTMVDKTIGPLQDAQQAIKVVRDNAERFGIDKNKIGIIGFSAGGHLASTAATHFQHPLIENSSNTSIRPDFQILVYPVITMQENLTHSGSRVALLGEHPSKNIVDDFSNELQVDTTTPPAYITHAGDDVTVDVDNSINYYEALRHHHVSAELHLYPHGGHGFIFRHPTEEWMAPILQWMKNSKWIH